MQPLGKNVCVDDLNLAEARKKFGISAHVNWLANSVTTYTTVLFIFMSQISILRDGVVGTDNRREI